ncbi:MAG: tetratricopeptide repeat protein, partial [Halioglobus sp.]
ARHYVQQKDYPSAIEYYQQALKTGGLADVANREMLRELAQVYLLAENYGQAAVVLQRALDIDLVPDARDFLLLAQAHYRLSDYVAVVVALDGIQANGLTLEPEQMRQALALYYRAGAFEQCESILIQLLKIDPGNSENWHQLASVYLQQNKKKQALDHLTLALEKKVPFSEGELLLLVDLQAINGNPFGAATVLEEAMAQGAIAPTATNQRKLFELWLQAREREKAKLALENAARASGDTELYLYLAQLQLEAEQWLLVQETLLEACAEQLEDRFVSRANLLLGISLLKQGREAEARRALINATLVGGANAQAAEWLRFMEAEPASESELRRVRGPCFGSLGKQDTLEALPVTEASLNQAPAAQNQQALPGSKQNIDPVTIKTVSKKRFFVTEHSESIVELLPQVKSLATRLNVSLVKAAGTSDGPLHVLAVPGEKLRLGIPIRGTAQAKGRYRIYNADAYKCAWMVVKSDESLSLEVLESFAERIRVAGHESTGDYRLVLRPGSVPTIELQMEIN